MGRHGLARQLQHADPLQGLPCSRHGAAWVADLRLLHAVCLLAADLSGWSFHCVSGHCPGSIRCSGRAREKTLPQVETVQRYIAEMKMRVDEARCMVYRVAQMSDNAMVLFNELNSADLLDEVIRANPDDPFFI